MKDFYFICLIVGSVSMSICTSSFFAGLTTFCLGGVIVDTISIATKSIIEAINKNRRDYL